MVERARLERWSNPRRRIWRCSAEPVDSPSSIASQTSGILTKGKFERRHQNLDLRTLQTIRKGVPRTSQHLLKREGSSDGSSRMTKLVGKSSTEDSDRPGLVVRIASVPSQEVTCATTHDRCCRERGTERNILPGSAHFAQPDENIFRDLEDYGLCHSLHTASGAPLKGRCLL